MAGKDWKYYIHDMMETESICSRYGLGLDRKAWKQESADEKDVER